MTPLEYNLDRLQKEIEDRNIAVSIIDAESRTELRHANNLMLEHVQPETLRRGSAFAKAFVALQSAHIDYNKWIDDLESAGANVETLRIHPNGLSDPNDTSGNYPWGRREFAERGFLPASQAPKLI